MQFSYLLLLKFPLLPSFVKESNSVCHLISSIFDKCPDRLITSITAKPYTIQNISFHWICSKFQHGHNCFWTSTSWRTKTSLRGQKWHERVDLLKKFLIKGAQQPQKPLDSWWPSNQFWVMILGKKGTSQQLHRSLYSSNNAMLCCCC